MVSGDSVSYRLPAFLILTEVKFSGMKMPLQQAEQFLPAPPLLVMMGAGPACPPLQAHDALQWKQRSAAPLGISPSQSPGQPRQSCRHHILSSLLMCMKALH